MRSNIKTVYCHLINIMYAGYDFVDTISLHSKKQEVVLHRALYIIGRRWRTQAMRTNICCRPICRRHNRRERCQKIILQLVVPGNRNWFGFCSVRDRVSDGKFYINYSMNLKNKIAD